MTPNHFKCSQFRKGTLVFNFVCINLLQNDFCKQRYITLNATISGLDRIHQKTHLCRTCFAEYICIAIFWTRRRPDHVTSTAVTHIIQPYRQPYHKNANTLAPFFCYAFFFNKRPFYLCINFVHIFHWLIRRKRE